MVTKQDLVDEYVAQMLRVCGLCTPDMGRLIDNMSIEKLETDLKILRKYADMDIC